MFTKRYFSGEYFANRYWPGPAVVELVVSFTSDTRLLASFVSGACRLVDARSDVALSIQGAE